jgi:hypothetical protein
MVWISEKNLIHHYHYYNFWPLNFFVSLPSSRLFDRMPFEGIHFSEKRSCYLR